MGPGCLHTHTLPRPSAARIWSWRLQRQWNLARTLLANKKKKKIRHALRLSQSCSPPGNLSAWWRELHLHVKLLIVCGSKQVAAVWILYWADFNLVKNSFSSNQFGLLWFYKRNDLIEFGTLLALSGCCARPSTCLTSCAHHLSHQ